MAKQPKKAQTEYTIGGRDISNTAIPLYQANLKRMDEYLQDPSAKTDFYLNKYYTNTPEQNDFLRNYQRSMGDVTANNYTATNGGVASLNQRNYDDYQRYYNDQAARLYNTGISNAYNMGNQDYQNMLAGNQSYNAAYQLGKAYSDVEQYNDMVDQLNNNAWAGWVGDAGKVVSMIPTPWTMAIGGAMQGVGSAFQMDDSALRGMNGTANDYGMYQNMMSNQSRQYALNDLFNAGNKAYKEGKLNWLLPKSKEVTYNPAGIRGM